MRMRASLFTTVAAAALLVASGCQTMTPMAPALASAVGHYRTPPAETSAIDSAAAGSKDALPATAATASDSTPSLGPFPELSEQEAMRVVAPKLAELARLSPEAHADLMQQLASASPSVWELAVDRAMSTQAYRNELAVAGDSPVERAVAAHRPMKAPAQPTPHPVMTASANQPSPQLPPLPEEVKDPLPAGAIQEDAPARVAMVSEASFTPRAEPSAQQSITPAVSRDWRSSLEAAIAALEASNSGAPLSKEEARDVTRLRLLQLAAGRDSEAMGAIDGLSSVEQAYWKEQLYSISTMLDSTGQPDSRRRTAIALTHHDRAAGKLRSMASLQVRNLTFCSEVYAFGAYEGLEYPRFKAGEQATLYTEVDNYHSESTDRGMRTSLASSYRLFDSGGAVVDSGDFPQVDDLCSSHRRDFHIQYGVTLPVDLAPGEYDLELTITDRLGDKIGRDRLPLTITE